MKRPIVLGALLALSMMLTSVAAADSSDPGGSFADDDGNIHEGGIEAIAASGITLGCNPPGNYLFCPSHPMTRAQMAAFLSRSLGLPVSTTDHFVDDEGSVFEGAIDRLADAGITEGCNPPTHTRFCPDRVVTRGEMAAFLARAFKLPNSTTDHFSDDDGHLFEGAIDRIADARITQGCNPPANTRFCPDQHVERDQLATFLTRALGLAPMRPPEPTLVPVLSVTDGDTIRVLHHGSNEPLRLIGIETPEMGARCAVEATAALADMVQGRTIRIDQDVSDRDAFGRLLRYVFLRDGTLVNAELVRRGLAKVSDVPPDSKYAAVLSQMQDDPAESGIGIWGVGSRCAGTGGGAGGGEECDRSYPTVCIPPPPPVLNCSQIQHRNFLVIGADPHGFDEDNDGLGCET